MGHSHHEVIHTERAEVAGHNVKKTAVSTKLVQILPKWMKVSRSGRSSLAGKKNATTTLRHVQHTIVPILRQIKDERMFYQ